MLWTIDEGGCTDPAVASVLDQSGAAEWGCERHAAAALAVVDGAKLGKVADWDAARRLLALPWNR